MFLRFLCALVLLWASPALALGGSGNGSSWVNGVLQVGSGGTGCTGIRVITSGSTDMQLATDCVIAWNSATNAVKAETLLGCTSVNAGQILIIVDEYGNAGRWWINFTAPTGTTIGTTIANQNIALQAGSITNNGYSTTLECDGISNWIVVN